MMKKEKKLRLIMKGDIRLFIFQQMVDLNMISLVKLAVSLRRFNYGNVENFWGQQEASV